MDYSNNIPDNYQLKSSSAPVRSFPTTDYLSLALHAMSQSEKLTHLDLSDGIIISPSLFWPDTQAKQPYWPNLLWVRVMFSATTADGEWYFTHDDKADTESDSEDIAESETSSAGPSAVRADPGNLDPLLEAAARAAAQMPRLQCLTLETEIKASTLSIFAMTYLAPGERTGWGPGSWNVDRPRLNWAIGPSDYEPEESILEIWRQSKGEILQSVGVVVVTELCRRVQSGKRVL